MPEKLCFHLHTADLYFQFALIAAYLDPRDEEEWARLAEMCVEQNDLNQATKCYSNGKLI